MAQPPRPLTRIRARSDPLMSPAAPRQSRFVSVFPDSGRVGTSVGMLGGAGARLRVVSASPRPPRRHAAGPSLGDPIPCYCNRSQGPPASRRRRQPRFASPCARGERPMHRPSSPVRGNGFGSIGDGALVQAPIRGLTGCGPVYRRRDTAKRRTPRCFPSRPPGTQFLKTAWWWTQS